MAWNDFLKKKRNKPGEVTAKDWKERVKRALDVRKAWWNQQQCATGYAYFQGRQRPEKWSAEEWITVNLIYSSVNAELPSLYAENPEFNVALKRSFVPDPATVAIYEELGKVRAAMLNYLKDELKVKSVIRQMVFDSFFAYGVVKVSAEVENAPNPKAGQPIYSEDSGAELMDDEGAVMWEPEEVPVNTQYKVLHLHPLDFLVDEDAGPIDPADVKWKAHVIKMPLKKLKEDKRYDQKVVEKLRGTELTGDQKDRETRKKGLLEKQNNKEADIVVLYEIYDLDRDEWLTIADGCDEYLAAPAPMPTGIDGDPFVTLRLNLNEDTWYPVGHVAQLIPSQREYNETRSYKMRHRKNVSARIYTLDAAAFENPAAASESLALGQDGTVITYDRSPGYPPINPVRDAPLDSAMDMELAYLKADFTELSIGSNQRGAGAGIDSATEAGIVERRQQVREGDRRALVAESIASIGRKLDQLVQATITVDQMVRVTGPQGAVWQLVPQRAYQDIKGEYEYTVDYSAAMPYLPEVERAQMLQLLSTLATFPHLLLSASLTKKLAELFGIKNENTVKEIMAIGAQIMGGQLPMPGNGGSPPGEGAQPAQASTGQAMGPANMRGGQ